MLPMICPQCSHNDHRATATNSKLDDQIVRRRVCQSCGHAWFTVEVPVPNYAVGWSKGHLRKPVLRVPLELQAAHTRLRVGHVEAKDQLAALREASERRSAEADERHRM
jgi:hypothetical protein